MPLIDDVLRLRDGFALMGCCGLGGTLHDAVALADSFGAGTVLGIGAGEAAHGDIIAPAAASLGAAEVAAAAALGRARYFLSFGNAGLGARLDVAPVAGVIEQLAAVTGVGFMAVCVAAPGQSRTVYHGHLFEGGRLRGDLARAFSLAMDGSVGVVPHEIVAAGAAAIRAQCGRLKEQGKVLVLIDAVSDADCVAVAEAMARLQLAGGVADFAGVGTKAWPADEAVGPVAVISGALDRQTIFQIGAARGARAVYDVDFGAADPVAAALEWAVGKVAADQVAGGGLIITSSVPPDRLSPDVAASAVLGDIARGLAAAGLRRFVIAGGETARFVCAALGLKKLRAAAKGDGFFWLRDEDFSISIKPPSAGGKNLFLSEFEPHLRLNNIAELTS